MKRIAGKVGHVMFALVRERSGATAIEYGLIMAMIFLAIVAAVRLYASNVGDLYNNIAGNVSGM